MEWLTSGRTVRDPLRRRPAHVVHPAEAFEEAGRLLRAGWQDQDPETQSTELRLALREYREITGRLLRA